MATDCMILTIWHSGENKTMVTLKRLAISGGVGQREGWTGRAQGIFLGQLNYSVWYCDSWYRIYMRLIEL